MHHPRIRLRTRRNLVPHPRQGHVHNTVPGPSSPHAPFRVLIVGKEPLVQQPHSLHQPPPHQHRTPGDKIHRARLDPQLPLVHLVQSDHPRPAPLPVDTPPRRPDHIRPVVIINRRASHADLRIRLRRLHQSPHQVRSNHRVIVQNQHILRPLPQRVPQPCVISARIAQILPVLQHRHPWEPLTDNRHRPIRRAIVHHHHLVRRGLQPCQRLQALHRVRPPVPIQDHHRHPGCHVSPHPSQPSRPVPPRPTTPR